MRPPHPGFSGSRSLEVVSDHEGREDFGRAPDTKRSRRAYFAQPFTPPRMMRKRSRTDQGRRGPLPVPAEAKRTAASRAVEVTEVQHPGVGVDEASGRDPLDADGHR